MSKPNKFVSLHIWYNKLRKYGEKIGDLFQAIVILSIAPLGLTLYHNIVHYNVSYHP